FGGDHILDRQSHRLEEGHLLPTTPPRLQACSNFSHFTIDLSGRDHVARLLCAGFSAINVDPQPRERPVIQLSPVGASGAYGVHMDSWRKPVSHQYWHLRASGNHHDICAANRFLSRGRSSNTVLDSEGFSVSGTPDSYALDLPNQPNRVQVTL